MLRLLKDRLFHSLLIVSALICSAYGDYFLYWTTAEYVKNEDIKVDEVKAAALYAYAYDNETQTTTKKLVERMTADDIDLDDYGSGYSWLDFHQDSSLVSLGDTYSGYSFYVDLYSTDDSSQFNEENLIFNGLENNLTSASELSSYISENIASPTPDNYWHVNLSLVPEPSLGLMVLIGLSFLALRRRNGRDDLPWGGGAMSAKSLIFAIFALSSPFVVLSDELDAVSDNYYSILKVDAQSKETAIAVPFVAIAAATNQQPISVAEAVDTRSLSEGDMLMIYDHVKERYNSYQVNANDTWEAVRMVTRTSEGEVEQDDGEVASKMKVAPGYGSWLIRKNTANSIVLHGQIPYSVKIEVKTGKNLIGSTTLDQTDFNNCSINWSENGVVPTTFERVNNVLTYDFGDSIMFTPPGGTESRVIYYVKVGDAEPKWRSIGKKVVTVLPTGCACWLIHKGSGFSYDTYALEDDQQEGDQSTEQEQEGEGNE